MAVCFRAAAGVMAAIVALRHGEDDVVHRVPHNRGLQQLGDRITRREREGGVLVMANYINFFSE